MSTSVKLDLKRTQASTQRQRVGNIRKGVTHKKSSIYAPALMIVFFSLLIVGLANLYSASRGGPVFFSQLRATAIGMTSFVFFGWFIKPDQLKDFKWPIYVVTIVLLGLVLLLGKIGGGSQRWLNLGFFTLQPSELAKVTVCIMTASFLSEIKKKDAGWVELFLPLVLCIVIATMIFPQPDFGTAGFCLILAIIQCLTKIRWRSLVPAIFVSLVSLPLMWTFLLHSYQKRRVISFLNPSSDQLGSGYNALQSIIAIGSGGWFGKGYMAGSQSQYSFLPKPHTDFVFSVFAEEHGLVGSFLVVLLFLALATLMIQIARSSYHKFSSYLVIGLAGLIFVSVIINIAMVLRLFPIVGLPLPLFSQGGSNLLTVFTAMGIVVGVDRANAKFIHKSKLKL